MFAEKDLRFLLPMKNPSDSRFLLFAALPDEAQTDLDAVGLGGAWFAGHDPTLVQTVLNLYAKLRHLGLWHHLAEHAGPTPGALNFRVRDRDGFRAELEGRSDFVLSFHRNEP